VEGQEGVSSSAVPAPMTRTPIQLWVLRLAGVLGAALFGFFFVLTFSTPQWVERFAVDFIETRVSEKVNLGIEKMLPESESVATRVAENLFRQNEAALEQMKQQFRDGVRATWTAALAEVRDLDCECREKLLSLLESGTERHRQSIETVSQRLTHYIQATYMDVATDLKRDIRIFTATNAGVFLLLVLVSFLKPAALRHLFVPGLLLCAATLICAYGYVFAQNWLLTVINGSYLGFAYALYLGVAFLFLCDILLNQGRVTTRLANGLIEAVGGVASLIPC
jgi:hypothetical protein